MGGIPDGNRREEVPMKIFNLVEESSPDKLEGNKVCKS